VINGLKPKPFTLVGIVDDDPEKWDKIVRGYRILAGSDQLLKILEEEKVSDIIVAISGEIQGSTFQTLLDAQHMGVEIARMPVVYEQLLGRVPINILEADWILRGFIR
jgi:FlaA1/EpsC-like NDP-sugar epimerase